MHRTILALAAGTTSLVLGACAPEGKAPAGSDSSARPYSDTLGARGVTPEQAEWLARHAARPAGR